MKRQSTSALARRYSSADIEQLRQMTRAARLHLIQGARQTEIAEKMGISQAGVSRLLRMAEEQGIIRSIVVPPEGLSPDLETALTDAAVRLVAAAHYRDQASVEFLVDLAAIDVAVTLDVGALLADLDVDRALGGAGSLELGDGAARQRDALRTLGLLGMETARRNQPVIRTTPGSCGSGRRRVASMKRGHATRTRTKMTTSTQPLTARASRAGRKRNVIC